MNMYFLLIATIFSSSFLFAGSEVKVKGGKVEFLYDAEQVKVDAFVAVGTTTEMTNKYSKPSAFETMVSTTIGVKTKFEFEKFLTKAGILEEIKKQKSELTLLESLKNDEGIDTSAEQVTVKQKLSGLKHAYGLAP